ncbi:hypothetical protein G7Y89_g5337 [Cudoniella acicularis]|uniref:FAD-binding domain-containing protein n=1 Tax=Cudoniella acicularis TaxID=354080 RepID=A0A8H4RPS4_9HELO|nr:hypothetical protein G7Y89_g5337 [Cudoniella acicularis]
MTSKSIKNVVIIGGGISGPALALALQKHSINSTLYEGRPSNYKVGGSIALSSNAMRMLDNLGLATKTRSIGYPGDTMSLVNLEGKELGILTWGSETLFGYPAIITYRNSIRELLLDECQKNGISVRYDMRFVGASEDPETGIATARFANGEIVEADLLVGADGIFSRVREAIMPGHTPKFRGQVTVRGFTASKNIKGLDKNDVRSKIVLSPAGSFAVLPADKDADHIIFFSTLTTHARSKEEWREFSKDQVGLKAMLQDPFSKEPWSEYIRNLVTQTPVEGFDCWPFHTITIPQYTSTHGHILVLGDAAHGLPPSAGQGGSMALEDALTLALTISHFNTALSSPSPSPSLLNHLHIWHHIRKQRIAKVEERTNASTSTRTATLTKSEEERGEKEKALKEVSGKGVELEWLYGYSVEGFEGEFEGRLAGVGDGE